MLIPILASADKDSSVFFFELKIPVGLPNQPYLSYTVDGGNAVTGTTVPSIFTSFGPHNSVSYLDTVSTYILVIVLNLLGPFPVELLITPDFSSIPISNVLTKPQQIYQLVPRIVLG
jgi:hypothetical protein